jgi:hypothetical protein
MNISGSKIPGPVSLLAGCTIRVSLGAGGKLPPDLGVREVLPADHGEYLLCRDQLFGSMKPMLEHGASADEVNILFRQRFTHQLLNIGLQTSALSAGQNEPPKKPAIKTRLIHHESLSLKLIRGVTGIALTLAVPFLGTKYEAASKSQADAFIYESRTFYFH